MVYYPRWEDRKRGFYSTRTRQFGDPSDQAAYDDETDSLFREMIAGIVGGGTNEAGSIERKLAFDEGDRTTINRGEFGAPDLSEFGSLNKRYKTKGNMPSGRYSPGNFPGLMGQVFAAESGMLPKGYHWSSLLNESPDELRRRQRQQLEWAMAQRAMLGLQPNMSGMRGRR